MWPPFGTLFASAWLLSTVMSASVTTTASSSLVETGSIKSVETHIVTVGKVQNQFDPDSLQAKAGDIIEFDFFPPNHSVGRAEYLQPCIPYEDTGQNKVGFFSGFFPLQKILPNPPTWNLTINDTEPVFLYCAAPGSCINYQMVAVINPNSSVSLAKQKQGASDSTYMLAPGEAFPSEGSIPDGDLNPDGGDNGIGYNTTSSAASASSRAASAKSAGGNGGLSGGAIAGIVVAAVCVIGLLAGLFFLLGRQKSMLQFMHRNNSKAAHQQHPSSDMRPAPGSHFSPSHQNNPATSSTAYFGGSPQPDPQYGDSTFVAAPPYPRQPEVDRVSGPKPGAIAELADPADKHFVRGYVAEMAQKNSQEGPRTQDHPVNHPCSPPLEKEHRQEKQLQPQPRVDSPELSSGVPSPMPSPRPLSFWGNRRSQTTESNELSADSPMIEKGGRWHRGR